MISKTELASDFVKEYQDENGVSKYSKKKTGELLYHRHPDIYKDPEDARVFVRLVTGAKGKFKPKESLTVNWKGFEIPKPEKNDFSKVIIKEKRIGLLSDIHIPYYDKVALEASIHYLIKWKPDCIILNGDTVDMYHASNFESDPKKRSIKYELDMLRGFLYELRGLFPNTRIVYKYGNHCERYEKKILQRLPEFIELEWTKLSYVMDASKLGIDIVTDKRLMKAGHLNIGHAHELSKGFIAPVNVARGFFMKTKANFIGGHHHRTSEHLEQDLNGKIIGAWSTGCLCELNPHYMPINAWNHGFATVEVDGNDFTVKNLKIIKGKVV